MTYTTHRGAREKPVSTIVSDLKTRRVWVLDEYGRVENLDLREASLHLPAAGQVAIEVEAVSLNPLDLKLIAGDLRQMMPISFPFVPCNDVCGKVIATGEAVNGLEIGDRVVAMLPGGALATHAVAASGPTLARVPAGLDPADVASLPVAGLTALQIIRASGPLAGASVAVIGATGGVGLFVCQLAAQAGAHVIATATGAEEALVREAGAADTLDYRATPAVPELRRRWPSGLNVVINLVGQLDALLQTATAVKPGGRLVSTLIGPDPSAFPDNVGVHYIRLSPTPGDLASLVGKLADRTLRAHVVQSFAFEDAPAALTALRDGHVRGKIVVRA